MKQHQPQNFRLARPTAWFSILASLVLAGAWVPELRAQGQTNANVLTYHNDQARTGQNLNETVLTLNNVNTTGFGKLFTYTLDGWVFAQPLYVEGVSIPGKGKHNVIYIATEHNSVYAFDADSDQGPNAAPLWQVSFINPAAGVTTVPMSTFGFDNPPELGITGTPVIDPSTGTLFVVAKIKTVTNSVARYAERLFALDISTGHTNFGGSIDISPTVPGTGAGSSQGKVQFDALYDFQRAGLALQNGIVYVAFASQGDQGPYHGWVVGYDAHTLKQVQVYNSTPNGFQGGIWMGGGAPAVDEAGNFYVMTGNGTFDVSTPVVDFGESFVKLTPQGTNLVPTDYFTPYNQAYLNQIDGDLGSGAPMVLPDSAGSPAHRHLLTGAGKYSTIYLLDRDNMGHYNPSTNNPDSQAVQTINVQVASIFATPAYFNGLIYYLGVNGYLRAYSISNAQMSPLPVSQATDQIGFPGATPSISANGTNDGIVWVIRNDAFNASRGPSVLLAYNATNLFQRLYQSTDAGTRDSLGMAQKFSVPTIANGKVYVATAFGLTAFGNLGAPFVTTQPQSQTVGEGTNVTFNVGAGGTPPLRFQWQFNGADIVGATNTWLTLSNTQAVLEGTYTVNVANSIASVSSDPAELVVNPPPPLLSINAAQELTIQGEAGRTYSIQSTTDLADGEAGWVTTAIVTLTNSTQLLINAEGSAESQRFYRAKAGAF
ncbi:MAG: hypothetical protein JWR69_1182 [Pedosphaera sp.]|nr:hypothetical protein [Pedosphaera sp.]